MKRRKAPIGRPRPSMERGWTPPLPGTLAASREQAAALLELARANHHLRRTLARKKKTTIGVSVGGNPIADEWARHTKGLLTALHGERVVGPRLTAAVQRLLRLESQGVITAADAERAFDEVTRFLHSPSKIGAPMSNDDIPAEMALFADGLDDEDGVGCDCPPVSGLGDLAIAGLPSYLLTRKGLSNPVLRRRAAAAIQAMAPKTRRRVMGRLKVLASMRARNSSVSGAIRSVTPSIGHYEPYSEAGAPITVGRCPYASVSGVAGLLTP